MGPTMSKAMGPSREMKHPSKKPIPRARHTKNQKLDHAVNSIVNKPIQKKEIWGDTEVLYVLKCFIRACLSHV